MSTAILSGKCVLVTGSSSGIGLGIASQFAKVGARVILHGVEKEEQVQHIISQLKSHTKDIAYTQSDLATESGCQNLVQQTTKKFGGVDVLINNAGLQFVSPVESFTTEKWELLMRVNLFAPFFLSRAVLPNMYEKGWGRLIHIGSAHSLRGSAKKAAYVASKHGVVGLSKVLALEAASNKGNVTSNTICPGWVLTPLVQQQIDKIAKESGITEEEAKGRLLLEKHPEARFAKPENLGALAVFLASDNGAECNGAAFSMDVGWTAR